MTTDTSKRPTSTALPDHTLQMVDTAVVRLAKEFEGTYNRETVQRFVDESLDALKGSKVANFVPLLAERFARDRLWALAKAEGRWGADTPTVLFLCVENAGRSQMAAAWLQRLAGEDVRVFSGGSLPGGEVNPVAKRAMDEVGIDLTAAFPKPWTDEIVRAADVVVTMGCGDACPVYPGKRYEDWDVTDPAGADIETVREVRDEIEQRVRVLMVELGIAPEATEGR